MKSFVSRDSLHTNALSRSLIFGLALACWLIARPFNGIWHDSKFYTLQALQHLDPSAFSQDLFFLYGSQDQYSLFSHLHAAAISIWGLTAGTMALQGLGLCLWFVAAWALTRILPGKLAAAALLLIACADGHYGSHGLVSYGEDFLTARLYAEAFSLAGLAAWLNGRRTWGGMAFAAAFAMHPVMALPALMIGLGMLLRPGSWFGIMGAGAILALGLGVAGVQPFTGLLQPMDALWWQLAVSRSPFVFLHTWKWEGFSRALFVLVVTGTAWRTLPTGELRRLAGVTLTCVVGAFAIAYLGGALLKLPLIAGLQLTRVMWIAQIIALLLITAMLWESRQANVWDRVLALGLALAVFVDIKMQGGFALLVLAFFWLGKFLVPDYKPPVWFWVLVGLVPFQILLWGSLNVSMEAERETLFDEHVSDWRIYFSNPVVALMGMTFAYWLLGRERIAKPLMWAGSMVVASLLVLALATWYDVQPEWDYDSLERQAAIAPIAARVPERATVYWAEEPEKAWFWLRRASYHSFSQTAGSVFSRSTAVEGVRRSAYVRPVSLRDSLQSWDEHYKTAFSGLGSEAIAQQVCRDPLLDFVIALSRPGPGVMYFEDPATGQGYGLYDCRALRKSSPTVSSEDAVYIRDRGKRHS